MVWGYLYPAEELWGYLYPAEERHTLSERSYAHTVHPAVEEEEESSQTVATGSNRARDLVLIADHAGVDAPADLIALAYDRNDGDIVNTIMDLTDLVLRRRLERELAERQAEEEEDVLDEAGRRELDLWLLESQVPGCTREHAERAYEQGQEDVSRALPLARVTTLLADRACMVAFLMEQLPGSTRWEASSCYDAEGEDVVEAVIALYRQTQQRLSQPVLDARAKQRLCIRTVFMLALLYREWYGQLEPEAEEALAQVRINHRLRSVSLPSFRTPDGSVWTHTRQEGWERRAPLTPASLGRAVHATEQLADAAAARGHAQTAIRARRTADGMRAQLAAAVDGQAPPSPQSPLPPPVLQRSDERARLVHTPDGLERYTTVVIQTPRDRVVAGRYRELRDQDADTTGSEDEPEPPALTAESSSSSEAEEDDGTETPTAGTYARPRPFVRAAARIYPQDHRWEVVKRNLRIVQEQLDTEMASAVQGVVMSEGGYIAMMNAIRALWEEMCPRPDPAL